MKPFFLRLSTTLFIVAYFFCTLLYIPNALADELDCIKNQVLYLGMRGDPTAALEKYRTYCFLAEEHDYELLNRLCLIILEQGAKSEDPEKQLLSFFGAGFCLDENAVPILEAGLNSSSPELQVICLHFLSQFESYKADELIRGLFRNPNPLIQLEASFCLAKKKHPMALDHAESLLARYPAVIKPIFPIIFATIGTPKSDTVLRQLMNDCDENVRIQSIICAIDFHRDHFLPQIRRLAMQTNPLQMEACAVALGAFKDEKSICRLEKMLQSSSPYVAVSAAHTLYTLGRKEYAAILREASCAEFLFAITLLKDVKEAKELLVTLTRSNNMDVRLNATLALLFQRDPRCIDSLKEIMFHSYDKIIVKTSSPGKALSAYRWISTHSIKKEITPAYAELSQKIRIGALQEAINLPEQTFLALSKSLFENNQNDLIPTLVHLLENIKTDESISLLKTYQQKVGAPFIRNYCNLALFRLQEEGPYEENLRQWLKIQYGMDLIKFRDIIPFEMRLENNAFELSPHESTALFVASIEALIEKRDEKDIALLLEAMEKGNEKNRYALSGLLMRAIR